MKVVIAEFSTDNIDLLKAKVNHKIDKEVGTLLYHTDGKQAQYFIDEELSYNQGVIDLLVNNFQIVFTSIQAEGIINGLKVFTDEITEEDFKKLKV